jgi:hypothetical protein
MRLKIPLFICFWGWLLHFVKKRFKLPCFNLNRGKSRVPPAGLHSSPIADSQVFTHVSNPLGKHITRVSNFFQSLVLVAGNLAFTVIHTYMHTERNREIYEQKPNSLTYNFAEVSRHNLESS